MSPVLSVISIVIISKAVITKVILSIALSGKLGCPSQKKKGFQFFFLERNLGSAHPVLSHHFYSLPEIARLTICELTFFLQGTML